MTSDEPLIVVAHRCQLTFDGTSLSIHRYGLSARLSGLARYEDIPARQITSVQVHPPGFILGRGMLRLHLSDSRTVAIDFTRKQHDAVQDLRYALNMATAA